MWTEWLCGVAVGLSASFLIALCIHDVWKLREVKKRCSRMAVRRRLRRAYAERDYEGVSP